MHVNNNFGMIDRDEYFVLIVVSISCSVALFYVKLIAGVQFRVHCVCLFIDLIRIRNDFF